MCRGVAEGRCSDWVAQCDEETWPANALCMGNFIDCEDAAAAANGSPSNLEFCYRDCERLD